MRVSGIVRCSGEYGLHFCRACSSASGFAAPSDGFVLCTKGRVLNLFSVHVRRRRTSSCRSLRSRPVRAGAAAQGGGRPVGSSAAGGPAACCLALSGAWHARTLCAPHFKCSLLRDTCRVTCNYECHAILLDCRPCLSSLCAPAEYTADAATYSGHRRVFLQYNKLIGAQCQIGAGDGKYTFSCPCSPQRQRVQPASGGCSPGAAALPPTGRVRGGGSRTRREGASNCAQHPARASHASCGASSHVFCSKSAMQVPATMCTQLQPVKHK